MVLLNVTFVSCTSLICGCPNGAIQGFAVAQYMYLVPYDIIGIMSALHTSFFFRCIFIGACPVIGPDVIILNWFLFK